MNLVILQALDQAGGGSRASLRGSLKALRHHTPDWQLTLVTSQHGPLSRDASSCGVAHRIASFPRFRKIWLRLAFHHQCRRLAATLRPLAPDAILSNEWVTAPHALAVARLLEVPAISYVRDFAAVTRGKKYLLHQMDGLLCVCESMRQSLIGAGYDPQKIHTVYNPILPPPHDSAELTPQSLQQRAPAVDRWLLYLGRISPRKNQLAAVATLKLLREQSGQNWGLLLAGDADASYAAEVTRAADQAGLASHVIPLGLITKPGCLFQLAEATVLTSTSEGLARVLIESFLCGKPAFSYPLDGLTDIYGDDMNRFVAPTPQPEALAATILTALQHDDDLRSRTQKIRLMLESRHSVTNHVAALLAALRI